MELWEVEEGINFQLLEYKTTCSTKCVVFIDDLDVFLAPDFDYSTASLALKVFALYFCYTQNYNICLICSAFGNA
jgi:hypothetical protein